MREGGRSRAHRRWQSRAFACLAALGVVLWAAAHSRAGAGAVDAFTCCGIAAVALAVVLAPRVPRMARVAIHRSLGVRWLGRGGRLARSIVVALGVLAMACWLTATSDLLPASSQSVPGLPIFPAQWDPKLGIHVT